MHQKQFYKSQSWRRSRSGYIAYRVAVDGGLCEVCGSCLGKIVHHKIWLNDDNCNDPSVSLAWDNLRYECQDCHNRERNPAAQNTGRICYGPNGEILRNPLGPDSPHPAKPYPCPGTEGRG